LTDQATQRARAREQTTAQLRATVLAVLGAGADTPLEEGRIHTSGLVFGMHAAEDAPATARLEAPCWACGAGHVSDPIETTADLTAVATAETLCACGQRVLWHDEARRAAKEVFETRRLSYAAAEHRDAERRAERQKIGEAQARIAELEAEVAALRAGKS
jgi:hypothetical protein